MANIDNGGAVMTPEQIARMNGGGTMPPLQGYASMGAAPAPQLQLPISNIKQPGNGMVSAMPNTTWGSYAGYMGNLAAAGGSLLGQAGWLQQAKNLGNQLINPVLGVDGVPINAASSFEGLAPVMANSFDPSKPQFALNAMFNQPQYQAQQPVYAPVSNPLQGSVSQGGGGGHSTASATGGNSTSSVSINNVTPMQFTPPHMDLAQAPAINPAQFAQLGGFNAPMLQASQNGNPLALMPQMQPQAPGSSGGGGFSPAEQKAINAAQWNVIRPEGGGTAPESKKEEKAPESQPQPQMIPIPMQQDMGGGGMIPGMQSMMDKGASIPLDPTAPTSALQAAREGQAVIAANPDQGQQGPLWDFERQRKALADKLFGVAAKSAPPKVDPGVTDPFAPPSERSKLLDAFAKPDSALLRHALANRSKALGTQAVKTATAVKPAQQKPKTASGKPAQKINQASGFVPPPPPYAVPPGIVSDPNQGAQPASMTMQNSSDPIQGIPAAPTPPSMAIPAPYVAPPGYMAPTFQNLNQMSGGMYGQYWGAGSNFSDLQQAAQANQQSAQAQVEDLMTNSAMGKRATTLENQANSTHEDLQQLRNDIKTKAAEIGNLEQQGNEFAKNYAGRTFLAQIGNGIAGTRVYNTGERMNAGYSMFYNQHLAPKKQELAAMQAQYKELQAQYNNELDAANTARENVNDRAKQIYDAAGKLTGNQVNAMNGWSGYASRGIQNMTAGMANATRYNAQIFQAQVQQQNNQNQFMLGMGRLGLDQQRAQMMYSLGTQLNQIRMQGNANQAQDIQNRMVGIMAEAAQRNAQTATIEAQRLPEIRVKLAQALMLDKQAQRIETQQLMDQYNTAFRASQEAARWANIARGGAKDVWSEVENMLPLLMTL